MPPHPLALTLARRLPAGACIVDFGTGAGRNVAALRELGFGVVEVPDAEAAGAAALRALLERFDAGIATHALLHGMPQSVAERIDMLSRRLAPNGLFAATFASRRDARYGCGDRIADQTFAPRDGDERGVPHVYYDEASLRAVLAPYFHVESLEERSVDSFAGSWAHPTMQLRGAVHWLLLARRREVQ